MASPKHLWSGDWEEEASNRTPPPVETEHPGYDVAPDPEPEPTPLERRPSRRGALTGAAVLVVFLVVVGIVLAVTLGGSKSTTPNPSAQASAQPTTPLVQPPSGGQGFATPTQTTPQQTTPQQTTPQQSVTQPNVVAGPTYDWLGMQINLTANGVTVGSLTAGGAADLAGVDPGDVIVAVNTSQITTIAQLQSAAKDIKLGQHFTLIVDRGSTPVTLSATLTGRPSRQ